MQIGGLKVIRRCSATNEYLGDCRLVVRRGRKTLWSTEVEHGHPYWLQYGLFRFLPGRQKQFVVHTYSGGAHCCYDYYIFDIRGHRIKKVYDSSRYDSANEIGDALVPVDIDKDGTYEFYRDVMAFDYMGFAGHASATFPPAIFSFDRHRQRFVLANRRFAPFVLKEMNESLASIKDSQSEQNALVATHPEATPMTDDDVNETAVREKFLYLVYAGKEREAWSYFESNYKSSTGNGYQEQFRDQFISEFRKAFDKDPTYRSIYPPRNPNN